MKKFVVPFCLFLVLMASLLIFWKFYNLKFGTHATEEITQSSSQPNMNCNEEVIHLKKWLDVSFPKLEKGKKNG